MGVLRQEMDERVDGMRVLNGHIYDFDGADSRVVDVLPSSPFWTFADVEDRIVEAMLLAWRDEPGSWPFAGDGPWALIRAEWGDHGAHDAPAVPRLPLSRRERAAMDEVVRCWLPAVPDCGSRSGRPADFDRRLIVAVARVKAAAAKRGAHLIGDPGSARVDWVKVSRRLGAGRGAGAVEKRYRRAVAALCVKLNEGGL